MSCYGATPSNTYYPTAIYTQAYDGFADFPRYPLNFISDLNAVSDIATVHTKCLNLTGLLRERRPTLLPFTPAQPTDILRTLASLRSPEQIVNTAATVIYTDYSVLLPAAGTALAFGTKLPLCDSQLFLSQLA